MNEQGVFPELPDITLAELVEKAISNIREYEHEALARDPRGYRVGNSYGKDSCVVMHLCKMAGVKFWSAHSVTTLDPPEAIRFGRATFPDTIEERSPCGMALLSMLANVKTTLPTRQRRWCCDIFKERANGLVNLFGIRHAESRRRRDWKMWTPHITTRDWTLNPILFWRDDQLWKFINAESIPVCPLYKTKNCKRIGCVGCPLHPDNRREEFKKWPRYEMAWKWAVTKFWERLHDAKTKRSHGKEYYSWHKFKTPELLWQWYMEEGSGTEDDGCDGLGLT